LSHVAEIGTPLGVSHPLW